MMKTTDIFAERKYANVRKPLSEASTLPSWCYSDSRFFEREQSTIFNQCWHFVGRADEIKSVGDYLIYDSPQGSLIVMRSDSGVINAFRNACRHRGTRLLNQTGSTQRIICPYHSWVYGNDGALLRAPGMTKTKDFEVENCHLAAVRLESWAGFLFASYLDKGPSLSAWLGDMPEYFSRYSGAELKCVRRRKFTVRCNWKFLIENALETYHTGTVHQASLGKQQSEIIPTNGNWLCLRVFVEGKDSVSVLSSSDDSFPIHPNLEGDERTSTYFTNILPCTQFVFAPDAMWWLAINPVSASETTLEVGSCFPAQNQTSKTFDRVSKAYFDRLDMATPEDNAICEAQHLGNLGNLMHQGRFSAEEALVHKLANWVLDQTL